MGETTLKEQLAGLSPEKGQELVEQIHLEYGKTRYAELVAWALDRLQETTIEMIKGYGGNDNERLWNAVGRIQACEQVKQFLFPPAAPLAPEEESK